MKKKTKLNFLSDLSSVSTWTKQKYYGETCAFYTQNEKPENIQEIVKVTGKDQSIKEQK